MKQVAFYQVDAFADAPFRGNPAAVCVFADWPSDKLMQDIAAENNLAETAYIIDRGSYYDIRWFTNLGEIDFCGHATLASAHVVLQHLAENSDKVKFKTREVGELTVCRDGKFYVMDFPARPPQDEVSTPKLAIEGLGGNIPKLAYTGRSLMLVYEKQETVKALRPDYKILVTLGQTIIVTAPGERVDYVSRFFCPGFAVEEDPVTGSAHCMMAPYWAQTLGKKSLKALQFSSRGAAEILSVVKGGRVELRGKAVTVIMGTMLLPE